MKWRQRGHHPLSTCELLFHCHSSSWRLADLGEEVAHIRFVAQDYWLGNASVSRGVTTADMSSTKFRALQTEP